MGQWSKGGVYTPGKVEAARMEKNQWKRRANAAENRLRQIRNIIDAGESDAVKVVDAVCDAIDAWENDHPEVPEEMAAAIRRRAVTGAKD